MKYRIFLFLSLTLLLSSCGSKYERTEFIDGTFTPNGSVQIEGRRINSIGDNYNLTINSPIHINEIGELRLNWFQMENRKDYWRTSDGFVYFEVGKSDIGNGEYFIPTYYLKNYGTFDYQQRTLSFTEWIQFHPIWSILIVIAIIILVVNVLKYYASQQQILILERQRQAEEQRLQEIERRKEIILFIINNLYKETAREVHKTLIYTLLLELQDILAILNSDNLNDVIINGNITEFQNQVDFIKTELQRLKKLALDAQAKGYNDEENEFNDENNEHTNSEKSDGKMTKEKAYEILELKMTATKEEIKKAYNDLVKKYNTDQRSHLEDHIKLMLEEKMKELNNAKDFLKREKII